MPKRRVLFFLGVFGSMSQSPKKIQVRCSKFLTQTSSARQVLDVVEAFDPEMGTLDGLGTWADRAAWGLRTCRDPLGALISGVFACSLGAGTCRYRVFWRVSGIMYPPVIKHGNGKGTTYQ